MIDGLMGELGRIQPSVREEPIGVDHGSRFRVVALTLWTARIRTLPDVCSRIATTGTLLAVPRPRFPDVLPPT